MSSPPTRPDRCPGVFDTHPAADGALARIRLVGGAITAEQLQQLAQVSAEAGDGYLELTVRGNLQLRGITDVDAVAMAVAAAGLVPNATRDRVRNIAVSPLTGRIGGLLDVRPIADELAATLADIDGLDQLSGRFLFGLDDGRADVLARRADVCAIARDGAEERFDIVVGDEPVGSTMASGVVAELVGIAGDLIELGEGTWRIAGLAADTRAELVVRARARLDRTLGPQHELSAAPAPVVGWFDQDDGRVLLGGVVELGRIPARLAEFLAAIGAPIILTPDREILICDLGEEVAETVVRVLAPQGLIFDANSAWARLSCCVGAPGCDNSHAPVRDDLLAHVASGASTNGNGREHWVGCERGCGSPAGSHRRIQAHPDGYRATDK